MRLADTDLAVELKRSRSAAKGKLVAAEMSSAFPARLVRPMDCSRCGTGRSLFAKSIQRWLSPGRGERTFDLDFDRIISSCTLAHLRQAAVTLALRR